MGPYYIPRNVNDEGRILFIFTGKSLIYTVAGGLIGGLIYLLFSALKLEVVGIIVFVLFALIGFGIGTLKMPEIKGLKFAKKTGGSNIDDIIIRAIKFKMKRNRIYIYEKEEVTKDE